MPELAEVEYFRKRWSPGFGQTVRRVHLHGGKRIFRDHEPAELAQTLTGSLLLGSERKAKQMLFRFSTATLGLHLGMTGELSTAPLDFAPGKHDHLVLFLETVALVFQDPRLFGRVRFAPAADGTADPDWWTAMPEELSSPTFDRAFFTKILARRPNAALKALLLMQEYFPGIGNWMADEILWQSSLSPLAKPAELSQKQQAALYRTIKDIVQISLQTIGEDFGDPPEDWFFHQRWTAKGHCPKHQTPLSTASIGGRTTRWCPLCQP